MRYFLYTKETIKMIDPDEGDEKVGLIYTPRQMRRRRLKYWGLKCISDSGFTYPLSYKESKKSAAIEFAIEHKFKEVTDIYDKMVDLYTAMESDTDDYIYVQTVIHCFKTKGKFPTKADFLRMNEIFKKL